MKSVKIVSLAACSLLVLALSAGTATAKPEFAQKEKEGCATCHNMGAFPKQNAVGECYKRNGFKELAACKKDPKKLEAPSPTPKVE